MTNMPKPTPLPVWDVHRLSADRPGGCECGRPTFPCEATPVTDPELGHAMRLWRAAAAQGDDVTWRADPEHSPATRPGDTYDVLDADGLPVVASIAYPEAQLIAVSHNLLPRLVQEIWRAHDHIERLTNTMLTLSEQTARLEAQLYPPGEGDTESGDGIEVIR